LLDYFYYTALTVAALHENGCPDEQTGWRDLLTAHREQLREWAENYPPTFGDKYALVSAEIARLEGRDGDAMRLYEQAIQAARAHGFVQNEGVAQEVAARFYAAHGADFMARVCLWEARRCYHRWGAFGKVRQLEQLHPHLHDAPVPAFPTTTIGAPVEQLDIGTVIKASQAVSGEIVLDDVIKMLLRIAIEHAGAERGLLILFPGDEPWVAAEATTGRGQVEVTLHQTAASPDEVPESVLHYVVRTRESVILDDALAQNPFSADEYLRQKRARSVLCLPLVKQAVLIGALYLENNLATHVFTAARISILEVLASQAAISLENARLYNDLREREARIRRLVDSNIIGIGIWDARGRIIETNQAFLDIVGYGREDLVSLRWTELTPADWRDVDDRAFAELNATGSVTYEKEYFRKDGTRVPVMVGGAIFEWKPDEGVAFVIDMTERKRAEEKLRASEQRLLDAQMELAHAHRVTTMGQLTASIAHEVKQPISATVTNAQAALRFLGAEVVDKNQLREILLDIVKDGNRAGEVISRISDLIKKAPPRRDNLEVNGAIREVVELARGEALKNRVSVYVELAESLPLVRGDRVELQQVILNLVMNGIEALQSIEDRPRELVIRSVQDETQQVRISVTDCGVGISTENVDRLFNSFFTTKSSGMGMGLSICRSIMEAHGGWLWATANIPHGATFQLTLPVDADTAS
jgi:PAS domain S-box-containing protein